jgi:hypothetical protein
MKLTKTQIEILRNGFRRSFGLDQPRLVKAAQGLAALGLATVETIENEYGYKYGMVIPVLDAIDESGNPVSSVILAPKK